MSRALEGQILDDFEERLTSSELIPAGLVRKLMVQVRADHAPTAEALLETVKANVGDQSV